MKVYRQIDPEFLSLEARDLAGNYDDLTLIHLQQGVPQHTVVLSVLLHGNETSSLKILQDTLRFLDSSVKDYSVVIILGNLRGASAGLRHLESQPDFNRIWIAPPSAYAAKILFIVDYLEGLQPYCLIDLHNNTGSNPPYACVSSLDTMTRGLAQNFSGRMIYFQKKLGLLIDRLSGSFPAIVFECGLNMEPEPMQLALDFMKHVFVSPWNALELKASADVSQPHQTVGRVMIQGIARADSIGFELIADLESYNFKTLQAGEVFASGANIEAIRYINDAGEDLTDAYFVSDGRTLQLKRDVRPCMLTRDLGVALSDCIGYFLDPVSNSLSNSLSNVKD